MVVFITGASHTGKTALSQRLLEKYKYPYLSIDHLKMGLIRSDNTSLKPDSLEASLTAYLWPIVREITKTVIENGQNLIVEGCYIPFDWQKDFDETYLSKIRFCCLIFSENYIRTHYSTILNTASVIEKRTEDEYPMEQLIEENKRCLQLCQRFNCPHVLIEKDYEAELDFHI